MMPRNNPPPRLYSELTCPEKMYPPSINTLTIDLNPNPTLPLSPGGGGGG